MVRLLWRQMVCCMSMLNRKRIVWTVIALVAVAIAFTGLADNLSDEYAEEAFKRALVTFAVARALNGVISVAQGTEVAIEPGGVGVNFGVGQILDPINDLVEQFSSVMLVATSSLGLQNILLKMTGWWGTTLLLVLSSLFLLFRLWLPAGIGDRTRSLAFKLFLISAFLRFALPILIIGTHLVFNAFLEEEHDAATAVLEATSSEIDEFNRSETAQEKQPEMTSFVDRLGEMWDNSVSTLRISDRIERLKTSASNASEQIVNLIVIFALQTIILPLAFLWLFVEGLKGIAGRTTRL